MPFFRIRLRLAESRNDSAHYRQFAVVVDVTYRVICLGQSHFDIDSILSSAFLLCLEHQITQLKGVEALLSQVYELQEHPH